jgi:hypothetical protein
LCFIRRYRTHLFTHSDFFIIFILSRFGVAFANHKARLTLAPRVFVSVTSAAGFGPANVNEMERDGVVVFLMMEKLVLFGFF